jgi:hypothetical protein
LWVIGAGGAGGAGAVEAVAGFSFTTLGMGFVTVHVEQVPVAEVTVFAMCKVPAGSGLATVTVNDTVSADEGPTVTPLVQRLPAELLGVQDQPSVVAPVNVVLAGTVSDRVVDPGLPPPLVTVMW